MFPGYWSEGAGDKTCSKCIRFRPNVTNKNKGTCVGRDVVATGGCEMFVKKRAIKVVAKVKKTEAKKKVKKVTKIKKIETKKKVTTTKKVKTKKKVKK